MNKNIPDEMASAVTELSTELTAFDAEQSAAWREVVKQAISNLFYLLWAVYFYVVIRWAVETLISYWLMM